MADKTKKNNVMAKTIKSKKEMSEKTKNKKNTNNSKKITPKKEKKTDNGFLFILGGIVILFLIFAYLFVDITAEKSLEEMCLEYQNDPALQFPCKCVPTIREKNESDIVDVKTEGVCTCYCDIGNNQTVAIEVRKALK
ncbi:hypothetical protein GQ473_03705 [archaeon]|nr:hypothetical protein [archaeon]